MKILVLATFTAILIGCASTAKNLNDVSLGMTKSDVVSILGEPSETRASDGVEYMIYTLRTAPSPGTQTTCGVAGVYTLGLVYLADGCQYSDGDYFVQIQGGKVEAYGRIGDFGSTQKPEATININQTIKQER